MKPPHETESDRNKVLITNDAERALRAAIMKAFPPGKLAAAICSLPMDGQERLRRCVEGTRAVSGNMIPKWKLENGEYNARYWDEVAELIHADYGKSYPPKL